ncbi:site-specific DNA-methyltransferase [Glutamicibacter protophormiae]|uniref:site-specific DNA-methyltransferase n=1 Tax=Glutamicibacter protophormiae TaxID=37930 RepID=UPI00195AC953|nr:site-specific DNA-methyltransferase [Glutamicibacter protophormiae]QRQ79325.1 site-specific DNA-methyltransferase [Glutamicibacter protophormiae]
MSKSMFEVYLNEVTDENLRAKLKAEFERTTKKFGLVFERHSPEGIRMPQLKVRRGHTAVRETDGAFFKVHAISGKSVMLKDEHGNIIEEKLDNVTAAKQFGEVVFPGLKTVGSIRSGADADPTHAVINGENFHALEMLGYTNPESVDLIYIDPPYNTGNKTWQYNDHYVSEQDNFRHSKWLSFLERRLVLAKKILKPTGVIIVAIGDEEHHRLRMLMDQIFGDQNFISDVVWQGGRKNDSRYISNGADYMLVYAKSESALNELGVRWREKKAGVDEALTQSKAIWNRNNGDAESANVEWKAWLKGQKNIGASTDAVNRYDRLDSQTGRPIHTYGDLTWPGGGGGEYEVLHPTTKKPVKMPVRGWLYKDPARMQEEIKKGRVFFGSDETMIPRGIRFLDELDSQVVMSVFSCDRKATNGYLREIFGDKRFPNPKDVNVLMRWIRLIAPKDSVILDFFGGSGTTAEAVVRLNAEDQGTRQCILVTNNELSARDDAALRKNGNPPGSAEYEAKGVFHHVTKPRIEIIVTGLRPDGSTYSDGLPANVEFLELAYLDEGPVHAGLEYERLAPLFWLKSGAIGPIVHPINNRDAYAWNENSSMAVLFDAGKASELAEILSTEQNSVTHVFIITDSPEQGDLAGEAFSEDITVEPIYGSYLDAFQINRSDS